MPLEAEPEIDQHHDDRQNHRDGAALDELAADARAHDLDAAIGDGVAERTFDLLDHGLLRRVPARLLLDADEHVVGRAEFLDLDLAQAQAVQFAADCAEIRLGLRRQNLHQRTAAEIDAVVEAHGGEEQGTYDGEHAGQRERVAPQPHEADLGVVRDETQVTHGNPQIGTAAGRVMRSHCTTMSRVTVKAVNTVVTMPMASVTAKPWIGPVPDKNRITAAIIWVLCVSRMVAKARAKPASSEAIMVFPVRFSSRMRS